MSRLAGRRAEIYGPAVPTIPTTIAAIDWASWHPVDIATLCFVIRGDEVLLIRKKRGLGAGKINGPGGRLEPGETPREAAVREVEEELCVTPAGLTNHGLLRFQFVDGYSLLVHLFCATSCDGVAQETEEAIPLWSSITALPFDEMWADDRLWLPEVLAGRSVEGEFIFDGDTMLDHRLAVSDR